MNIAYWKDKRVLVTGHTGFKGSWLCLLLDSLGAKVFGYALPPPTDPSLYRLADVDSVVDSVTGDVRDYSTLASFVSSVAPEVVLHMAAQSVVLDSYNEPVGTYSTNVLGTVHVLEALRQVNQPCSFVNVTSDKCYENIGSAVPYAEGDRLGGKDPYSNSKACSELITAAYRHSYFDPSRFDEHGVAISTARAGNVIGGGDWTPWQLIPDVMQAFRQGKKVTLRHPAAVRPWQHVLDCLGGYLTLAERQVENPGEIAGSWNFGPSGEDIKPVSYIVEAIAAHWGLPDPWTPDSKTYAHEEPTLVLDSTRARRDLGWAPALPLDTALQWVVDWYRGYYDGEDEPRSLCRRQIDDFLMLTGTDSVPAADKRAS